MRILALDPGNVTGWAVRDEGGIISSGTWNLTPKRHEGGGMRYLRFRSKLREVIHLTGIDAVFYERVRGHRGTTAAQVYGGFEAQITEFAESRGLPYEGIHTSEVKQAATGKGGGRGTGKDAVVEAAQTRWPDIPIEDDNHADALWISEVAANRIDLNIKGDME